MLKLLREPYPSKEVTNENIISSIVTGAFIFLFLKFFQPFGINNWQYPKKDLYLFIYGLIATLTMLFNFFIIKKIYTKWFEEEGYTVGKHIIWSIYMIFSISIFNYIFSLSIGLMSIDVISVWNMFFITFLVGVFPTVFFTLTDYLYQLKKYDTKTFITKKNINFGESSINQIVLKAENGKDFFSTNSEQLLYIESSDNYATIVYINDNKIFKKLLRSSLNKLDEQISSTKIIRCHRSYIVNLNAIIKITGNAQGYKLFFHVLESPIPVARKFTNLVSAHFKK